MNFKKVDMQALGSVLGLGDLTGFEISNDDPDDGEVTIYSAQVTPEVCRESYVLKADGSLTYTRACMCVRVGDQPSAFDEPCSGMEHRELNPVYSITAGVILAILGENTSRSFMKVHAYDIASMRRCLGLAGKRWNLGTGN